MGASTLLAIIAMSCSIFLAIGQAVFVRRLEINLTSVGLSSVINDVLHTGATNLDSVVDAVKLPAVIQAYGKSVTQLFVGSEFRLIPLRLEFAADYLQVRSRCCSRGLVFSSMWMLLDLH